MWNEVKRLDRASLTLLLLGSPALIALLCGLI